MATPAFQYVLIIGGTSGLGEGFVRRYHSQGRKVIATGRRMERLEKLKSELPGLITYQSDVTDSGHFQSTIKKILAEHSAIDTVIMMSGVQNVPLFKDPNSINAQKISTEISTNLIAPCVLAQVLVPHFVSKKTPTNIVLVSSGLAYVPVPLYAVYNATKAGVHYFALGLRGQLADTSVNVVELAPPYVDTELDASHREMVGKMMGPGAPDPMPLNEYLDDAIGKLDQRVDGKPLKEVAVGFSENGVGAWRKAFDPILESMSLGAM